MFAAIYGTLALLDAADQELIADSFRRAFLAEVAGLAGRDFVAAPDTCFAAVRQAQLDVMGDLVAAHLDTPVLSRLIGEGPPAGLPVIGPAGAAVQARS